MTTLWFVVPAHGRVELTRVCLRQLARTCDEISEHGFRATAVIVACDENLETAGEAGFATVEQSNAQLGRRWNDGYELACRYGEADFVVPLGSDDWVDAEFVAGPMPDENEIRCTRLSSVVSEDGHRLARLRIPYAIGDGVRVIPRALLERVNFRPAEETRRRAIDTSVMQRLERVGQRPRIVYHDVDALQIVDWKSAEQLNSYERCLVYRNGPEVDPFDALEGRYPAEALEEMRAFHRELIAA